MHCCGAYLEFGARGPEGKEYMRQRSLVFIFWVGPGGTVLDSLVVARLHGRNLDLSLISSGGHGCPMQNKSALKV